MAFQNNVYYTFLNRQPTFPQTFSIYLIIYYTSALIDIIYTGFNNSIAVMYFIFVKFQKSSLPVVHLRNSHPALAFNGNK